MIFEFALRLTAVDTIVNKRLFSKTVKKFKSFFPLAELVRYNHPHQCEFYKYGFMTSTDGFTVPICFTYCFNVYF